MDSITVRAYAKLNLTLGVLYRRADGYHALDTIMQSVDLYDAVTVTRASDVSVTAVGMQLPYENTLKKAADLYRAVSGKGASIRVVKSIPAEAGMGGGSADAAAVLYALDRLYGETGHAQLLDMALSVGADVPFCLHGGVARCEGIGEIITPLSGFPLHFVVAKPKEGVSTKALFSRLTLPRSRPDTAGAIAALAGGDVEKLGGCLCNALQQPAVELVPEIGTLLTQLKNAGAVGVSMTGSGSAVFGLFRDEQTALSAKNAVDAAAFSAYCKSV